VVVHNTWIVTKAAKVYRFREHLMWMYDGDDKYFSSNTRLYLTYINQATTSAHRELSKFDQMSMLKTAMTIGYLLNRTVVLPRFYGGKKASEVPLNYVLHVQSFDNVFTGQYRENSFLRHPKVPPSVRSDLLARLQPLVFEISGKMSSRSRKATISSVDVVRQFGKVNDTVLKLGSLHGINIVFENSEEHAAFSNKMRRAFYCSNYRQLYRHQCVQFI